MFTATTTPATHPSPVNRIEPCQQFALAFRLNRNVLQCMLSPSHILPSNRAPPAFLSTFPLFVNSRGRLVSVPARQISSAPDCPQTHHSGMPESDDITSSDTLLELFGILPTCLSASMKLCGVRKREQSRPFNREPRRDSEQKRPDYCLFLLLSDSLGTVLYF